MVGVIRRSEIEVRGRQPSPLARISPDKVANADERAHGGLAPAASTEGGRNFNLVQSSP